MPSCHRSPWNSLDKVRRVEKLHRPFRGETSRGRKRGRGTAMAGGRNNEARCGDARRVIGWTPVVLAVILSLIPTWPVGGGLEAGEGDGRGGRSGRLPAGAEPAPPHGGVRRYEIGQGPRSYWLFEPDQPRPEAGAGRGLPPRLVRRQSRVLRRLDRPSGPRRPDRDLPAVPERRGHVAAGFPAQRDGRDPRRAGRPERRYGPGVGHVRPDPGGSR